MQFHIAKYAMLRTQTGRDPRRPAANTITRQRLPVVDKQKDLGCGPLKPSFECAIAANQANTVIRDTKRAFIQLDVRYLGIICHYLLDSCWSFRFRF